MQTETIEIKNPAEIDGATEQVAGYSINQLLGLVGILERLAEATGKQVRNAYLDRLPEPTGDAVLDFEETVSGRLLTEAAGQLNETRRVLGIVQRAWDEGR